MEKYEIVGGNRLCGTVDISGAKNAAVAILPAAILSDGVCRIENIPCIADVSTTLKILEFMGAGVRYINKNAVEINPCTIHNYSVPHDLARKMRASCYFLGALLGRFGVARVPMPGGCDFGVRLIDQHLKGFTALGAVIPRVENGITEVSCDRLVGNSIYLDMVSVGATVNIVLAAVKARGTTIIENAAKEPHIVDLANFLNSMGADIRGAGTDVIKVYGVERLEGTTYSIIPDQIEAGSYMVAAALTGGDILIRNVIPKHLESISAKLEEMGVELEEMDDAIRVRRSCALRQCNVKTMPHPGFPTDMQPQFAVLLALASGTGIMTEGVWDNRFRYIEELRRMGVDAQVDGKVAVIQGVDRLMAAPLKATDLRGGMAMVLAALVAQGTTEIEDIHHIDRGYEDIIQKLSDVGANIRRIEVAQQAARKAQ